MRWYAAALVMQACVAIEVSDVDGPDLPGASDIIEETATPSGTAQNFAVLLDNGRGTCTGALIAPNLVLTARHCLQRSERDGTDSWRWLPDIVQASAVRIGVGEEKASLVYYRANAYAFDADNLIGSGFRGNDIAVVRLASPVVGTPIGRPSSFPVGDYQTYIAIGWGRQTPDGTSATVLERQQAPFTVTNPADFAYQNASMPIPFPAADFRGGAAACPGDSGGPLVRRRASPQSSSFIVGVLSTAACGVSSQYTALTAHLPFLCGALRASGNTVPGHLLCTQIPAEERSRTRCCSGDETLAWHQ